MSDASAQLEPSDALESAVVIPVPEAEPLVGELRLEHDPAAAAGVPAHVTLLSPSSTRARSTAR